MAEQSRDNEKTKSTKRSKKCLWTIFVIILVSILGILLWRIFLYESVDEQLAAIDASLAIPDSENAAFYYRQFFSDPNNISALEDISKYTPSSTRAPWRDSEYQALAAKLQNNREVIHTLITISDKQKALFKIYPDPFSDWNLMSTIIRQTSFVLSWAAANDLAEGRTKEAITKYRCQIRIACHLQQTPRVPYIQVGQAIEAVGIKNIRAAAMRDDLTEEHLNYLNAILSIAESNPEPDPEIVEKLTKLFSAKERSALTPIARLRTWWHSFRNYRNMIEHQNEINKRLLFDRNTTEILIALRRFKDKTGQWPQTLYDIKPIVEEKILIDPLNNSSFVYKLTDAGFLLYSKGENNLDENGQRTGGTDDIKIWPR